MVAEEWRYLVSDGETQAVMLLSFAVQSIIACGVWLTARFVIRGIVAIYLEK